MCIDIVEIWSGNANGQNLSVFDSIICIHTIWLGIIIFMFLFFNYRGALHRKLGDYNAAIDDFLLALDKCDHDEESPVYTDSQRQLLLTYNDFAVECFTKGFFEEAIILLNKAIKGEKREKGLYVNRGGKFSRTSP